MEFGLEGQMIHLGYVCDGCDKEPIVGWRYNCQICEDFDYCEDCYKKEKKHATEHNFSKLAGETPIQTPTP